MRKRSTLNIFLVFTLPPIVGGIIGATIVMLVKHFFM